MKEEKHEHKYERKVTSHAYIMSGENAGLYPGGQTVYICSCGKVKP